MNEVKSPMEEELETWEEPKKATVRQKAIGCCALLIIIIFIGAMLLGYASWFFPYG